MPEKRSKRIQLRITPEADEHIARLADEFDTNKHTIGSMALSLGLEAIQKAWDDTSVTATVRVFNSIGPKIGIDPKDLTPEQWEQIRAVLAEYRSAHPD